MPDRVAVPPQPVISVRISDTLRSKLERLKEMLAHKSGESVSTSEVAKQLLESAREERLEVADLMSQAPQSLAQIRTKAESGFSLSRAEWILVGFFIREGVERFPVGLGAAHFPISHESMRSILEAFLAAYKIRKSKKVKDEQYLHQLPNLSADGKTGIPSQAKIDVPSAVERVLRKLDEDDFGVWPQFAGRNLYDLLEEEQFSNIEDLNRALKPYWNALWRVAARGHFLSRQRPVRSVVTAAPIGHHHSPHIKSVYEGGFVLSFVVGSEGELSILVNLPVDRQAMYEMAPYPVIAEFRSLLDEWDTSYVNSFWKGEHFFGYTTHRENGSAGTWIRCGGAVSFGFSDEEWDALKTAFRRAWQMPEVRRASDELALQYGEL